jgi:hypothetical protein
MKSFDEHDIELKEHSIKMSFIECVNLARSLEFNLRLIVLTKSLYDAPFAKSYAYLVVKRFLLQKVTFKIKVTFIETD